MILGFFLTMTTVATLLYVVAIDRAIGRIERMLAERREEKGGNHG